MKKKHHYLCLLVGLVLFIQSISPHDFSLAQSEENSSQGSNETGVNNTSTGGLLSGTGVNENTGSNIDVTGSQDQSNNGPITYIPGNNPLANNIAPAPISVSNASQLAFYGMQGKIGASFDAFGQPVNALFHDSFVFENAEGSVQLSSGLSISVKGGQAFNIVSLGLADVTTQDISSVDVSTLEGSIKFGIDGQHLLFSQPVQITMPIYGVADGTLVGLRVQHAGEDLPGTIGLTNNPQAPCLPDGSVSQEDSISEAIVENSQIIFYTCGASIFVADSTYGTGSPSGGFNDYVSHIVIQNDGKVVIGGNFTTFSGSTRNRIIRLNANGSVDTGFTIGGGFNSTVSSITIQGDGKIILGGTFSAFSGVTQNYVARLNADGTLDTSFNSGGTGSNGLLRRVALQSDGKILLGGRLTSYNGTPVGYIARLNSDGSLDTSFAVGTGFNGPVSTILEQPDGKIIVGGSFTTLNGIGANRIARFNTDGSIDTGFMYGTGFNGDVSAIVLQPDGKIIAGGSFTTYSGSNQRRIARLRPDGLVDTGFNTGGAGFNNSLPVNSLALQTDGKIVAAGNFTTYNSVTRRYITRLNSDGSLDTTFSPLGSSFNLTTITVAIQSDGQILIGGNFTTYNGKSQIRIARLYSTPEAYITSPYSGQVLTTGNVTIRGTGDANEFISLTVSGVTVSGSISSTGAWLLPFLGLGDSTYVITGIVTDHTGNSRSLTGFFTIDTTPPVPPTIISPSSGQIVTTSEFSVSGTGEPGATIVISIDNQTITGSVNSGGNWSRAVTGITNGSKTITGTLIDIAGNSSSSTLQFFVVTVTAPTIPTIISPSSGSSFTTGNILFTGTGDANKMISISAGGITKTGLIDSGGNRSLLFRGIGNGNITATGISYDYAGNYSGYASVYFTVNIAQQIVLTYPASGTTIAYTTRPTIGGISTVPGSLITITEGTGVIGTGIVTSGYDRSIVPNSPLSSGVHTICASGSCTTFSILIVEPASCITGQITVGTYPYYTSLVGTKLYVSNYISNNVSVIDILTNSTIATVSVGQRPRYSSLIGTNLYVLDFYSGTVSVIDTLIDTGIAIIPVGTYPMTPTAVGNKLYVVNSFSGSVSVIDANTNSGITTISVGTYPNHSILIGTKLYITNGDSNNVSVIDTNTDTVVNTISVGSYPQDAVTIGGKLYTINGYGNSVSVIDVNTDTVISTISIGYYPAVARLVGSKIYTLDQTSNTVSVINTTNDTLIASIPVGNYPYDLTAVGSQIYVMNHSDDTVSVINSMTDTVTNTITVGDGPQQAIAVGTKIYVLNRNSNNVYVIDSAINQVLPAVCAAVCGDGQIGSGEQCDLGSGANGTGLACSASCQRSVPTCNGNFSINPTSGTTPLSATITITGASRITGSVYLGLGSGFTITGNYSTSVVYNTSGVYTINYTATNTYSGSYYTVCSGSVTATDTMVITSPVASGGGGGNSSSQINVYTPPIILSRSVIGTIVEKTIESLSIIKNLFESHIGEVLETMPIKLPATGAER